MMMPRGWTIGAELELADCRRDVPLPGRSTWDRHDYTIVNSNGVANDPRGRTWPFGGEINTEPTDTVASQIAVVDSLLRALEPAPVTNYRTNLHVHVRVPGLASDLSRVRAVLRYVARFGDVACALVDPIPSPPPGDDPVARGAQARWRRRCVSHHAMLSPERLARALAASTVEACRAAHAPCSHAGVPQYQLAPRCAVNLRALWETPGQTVEFRHFVMSLDRAELAAALTWCVRFLAAALDGADQLPALPTSTRFPRQPLYDHWLETRYRQTSRRYHDEATICATLARWRQEGTLDARARVVYGEPLAEPAVGSLFP